MIWYLNIPTPLITLCSLGLGFAVSKSFDIGNKRSIALYFGRLSVLQITLL